MKQWIIIKDLHILKFYFVINDITEIAVCHPKSSMLAVFESKKDAESYKKEMGIKGQEIKINIK
jgi:hypothetical protein